MNFSEKAANEGKIIIISALDGTFKRTGFDLIMELIPLAEKVKKIAAICKDCGHNGAFTFRTAQSDQLELIGGESMYKPLCRECFVEQSKIQETANQGEKPISEFSITAEEGGKEGKKSANSDHDSTSSSGIENSPSEAD